MSSTAAAVAAMQLERARAEFMRRLSELEDLHFEAGLHYGDGPKVGEVGPFAERIRLARRAVVAAYDQATLRTPMMEQP